ncbi:MAG: O-antigen ligase family protein [Planctomycetaceae bacterium]
MATVSHTRSGSRRRSSVGRRSPAPPPESSLTQGLTGLTDFSLALVLFVVPACFGGRNPLGQLLLCVGATSSALLWSLRQLTAQAPIKRGLPGALLWVAALGLIGLQLVPLPENWLRTLSPELFRLLPLWYGGDSSGLLPLMWRTTSLDPAATTSGLATFLSYLVLFWVVVQRIGEVSDVERLLRCIALSGMAMAVFSLLQYFFSNGLFFWVYQHPTVNTTETALGSFTNRNHLAQFLALAIGPTLWWMARAGIPSNTTTSQGFQTESSGARTLTLTFLALGLGAIVLAGLLSLSRAGSAALGLACLSGLTLLWRKGQLPAGVLPATAAISLVVGGGFLASGYQSWASRVDETQSELRPIIWAANIRLANRFPWTGTGIGTHAESHQLEIDRLEDEREFSHAESGYLQIASESGLIGLGICLLMIAVCGAWWLRAYGNRSSAPIAAAAAGIGPSLLVNVLHSAVDFIWYAPGCVVVVVVLAACACRLSQWTRSAAEPVAAPRPVFRIGWVMSFALWGSVGSWTILTKIPAAQAEPHQTAFLRLHYHVAEDSVTEDDADEASENETREHDLLLKLKSLVAAARANPGDSRTHLRAALGYLELFDERKTASEMPLTVDELRDAAIAGEFSTEEELQGWLTDVVGPRRKYLQAALQHARRAVMLCPLQGAAYLQLARLSFLRDPTGEQEEAWREQALAVRPYSAMVDFEVGQAAFRMSDQELGMRYWKKAFQRSKKYRRQIVESLAPAIQAVDFVEEFQPNCATYPVVIAAYEETGQDDQVSYLRRNYADASMEDAEKLSGAAAEHAWMEAVRMHQQEQDIDLAIEIAEAALCEHSQSHPLHFALGQMLMQQKDYEGAAEHLQWAAARAPEDAALQRMAEEAFKLKLKSKPQATDARESNSQRFAR